MAVYRPPIPPVGCLFSFFLSSGRVDEARPTETMVRLPAPPVSAAARGSARAVAGVGCGSYLAGGSPPASDPREQRPVEPDSVYALKILKNGDNRALQQQQSARGPSRSEEALQPDRLRSQQTKKPRGAPRVH